VEDRQPDSVDRRTPVVLSYETPPRVAKIPVGEAALDFAIWSGIWTALAVFLIGVVIVLSGGRGDLAGFTVGPFVAGAAASCWCWLLALLSCWVRAKVTRPPLVVTRHLRLVSMLIVGIAFGFVLAGAPQIQSISIWTPLASGPLLLRRR
jgi:hypothetical protein